METSVRREATLPIVQRLALPTLDNLFARARGRRWPLLALAALAVAAGLYGAARGTGMFSVRAIEVRGARGPDAAQVRRALSPLLGSSLVSVDGEAVERRLRTMPVVASVRHDREFPHTLSVIVRLERPLAVLRRGPDSWLVSARGKVLRAVTRRPFPRLPRIWVPRSDRVTVGRALPRRARPALAALAPLATSRLLHRLRAAHVVGGDVVLAARSGGEIRLGTLTELRLKLAVAAQLLGTLSREPDSAVLDVTVPARPVIGGAHLKSR